MLLSKPAILRHMELGNIVIEPFKLDNLGSASYDVTLGKYYWREQHHGGGRITYNPYSKKDVERIWGGAYFEAEPYGKWMEKTGFKVVEGIRPDDLVVWIEPGETILCHTEEFIGGRNCVNTMMKARSSMGRNFIEICKDAGWGDIGYINRWTIEVTNNSRFYQIPLVVGRRIGQMTFFETEPVAREDMYSKSGKYQTKVDIKTLKKNWSPDMMLPRIYLDREVRK